MSARSVTHQLFSSLIFTLSAIAGAYLILAVTAQAAPSGGYGTCGMRGGDASLAGPRTIHPAMVLLDQNDDQMLSAEEIAAAPTILAAFDHDQDGNLNEEELKAAMPHPAGPPPGRHGMGEGHPPHRGHAFAPPMGPPHGAPRPPPPPGRGRGSGE